ncbi:9394_t:CDS:2, partial [Funneliformis geosporum]
GVTIFATYNYNTFDSSLNSSSSSESEANIRISKNNDKHPIYQRRISRNHHAHGITKSVGKWNDEKLQRLSTLALELVECLGDEDAFESLLIIKRNLSSELAEQYALPMKRKHENNEDEFQERKRHMSDEELGELIDFALNIAFINIWRTLVTSKDEMRKLKSYFFDEYPL